MAPFSQVMEPPRFPGRFIPIDPPSVGPQTDLVELQARLEAARDEERTLTDLTKVRSQLKALVERWRSLPADDESHDEAEKERRDQAAVEALTSWRSGAGKALIDLVDHLRLSFTDLPQVDDGPEISRTNAERRAEAEALRCTTIVARSTAATERIKTLNSTVQRSSARIEEVTRALASDAEDVKSLASALVGIAPHVVGEACPVCDRDYSDIEAGPLSEHISEKIFSLTNSAARIQAFAIERADESNRLAAANRDLLAAGGEQLSGVELAGHSVRAAQMRDAAQQLKSLSDVASTGTRLIVEAANARSALVRSRRRNELSMSMLPEIESMVHILLDRQASSFTDLSEAFQAADGVLIPSSSASMGRKKNVSSYTAARLAPRHSARPSIEPTGSSMIWCIAISTSYTART